jgi:hypothetical protein
MIGTKTPYLVHSILFNSNYVRCEMLLVLLLATESTQTSSSHRTIVARMVQVPVAIQLRTGRKLILFIPRDGHADISIEQ